MRIFPQPQSLSFQPGEYHLPADLATLTLPDFFARIKEGVPGVRLTAESLLAQEEYRLTVAEEGVEIASACEEGLFRAATTLRQMVMQGKVFSRHRLPQRS